MLEGEIISKGYSSPGRYSPCDGAIEKRILKRGLAQEGERDKKHGLSFKKRYVDTSCVSIGF